MFAHIARQSSRHIQHQSSSKTTFLARGLHQHQAGVVTTFLANGGNSRNFSVKDYPEANPSARALKTSFDLLDPTTVKNGMDGNGPLQLTKIVATIGPTSEQEEPLKKVVKAGMKIMRLNFSHATKEEVELRLKNLALSQVCMRVFVKCCVSLRFLFRRLIVTNFLVLFDSLRTSMNLTVP